MKNLNSKSAIARILLAIGVCVTLTACKIEHKSEVAKRASAKNGGFESKSFDPKKEVQGLWDSKAIPAIKDMALDYTKLRKDMKANLDEAGAKHGHREKGEGAPWNLVTTVVGKVIDTETDVSAGTASIDVDGDNKADVQIQIGPVIRGTAIRDVLPFISFTSYTNQIDYAQLANAFNDHAYETSQLKQVNRNELKGKKVEITGVFTADSATTVPMITATSFKVLSK